MARLVITIDGPAASGKSTVARNLAEKLNATFLDTGAMYRAVTLACLQVKAELTDERRILDVLNNTRFEFESSKNAMLVKINGLDVTEKIRDPQVTASARYVAASAPARKRLVEIQRQFAKNHEKVVTEGRDQGTVAFPDADVKFFLSATLDERAKRRQAELQASGIKQSVVEIKEAIRKRDNSDENRSVGPLKPADDAIVIDTTDLTIDEVVQKLISRVKERCSQIR